MSQSFSGATYNHERDYKRLSGGLKRVHRFMSDNQWHTLREISDACGVSEATASARIRDLRKSQYGGYEVISEYVKRGHWRYKLEVAG